MTATEELPLVDSGIDYITATTKQGINATAMWDLGRALVREEERSTDIVRPFRFSGYHGIMCGGAQVGRRPDGTVVRLSGNCAKEFWAQVLGLSDNVTRLDLQVTALTPNGCAGQLKKHYNQVRKGKRGRGKPAEFKMWLGPKGFQSMTLGARSSDRYARIYDKGLESGLPEFAGCLRYEIELKRQQAFGMAQHLDAIENADDAIARYIELFARARLTQVSFSRPSSLSEFTCQRWPIGTVHARRGVPEESYRARQKAMWLNACIRPLVHRFINTGQEELLLSALGMSDYVRVSALTAEQLLSRLDSEEVH